MNYEDLSKFNVKLAGWLGYQVRQLLFCFVKARNLTP